MVRERSRLADECFLYSRAHSSSCECSAWFSFPISCTLSNEARLALVSFRIHWRWNFSEDRRFASSVSPTVVYESNEQAHFPPGAGPGQRKGRF
jgi:hypothetical protein